MEKVFDNLIGNCIGQIKERTHGFTQLDGKKRYTIAYKSIGDTVFTSETSIARLDELFNRNINLDNLYDNFNDYISFTSDGKVKLTGYIKEGFQIDKLITANEKNGKTSINGLIVDLKRDEDFSDAYYNGITCNMPNCRKYVNEFSNHGDDIDENDFIDLLDTDEIIKFIDAFKSKVQSAIELYPQGLYVIVDSRIYYLTAQEYLEIYNGGIHKIEPSLLKDKKQVLYTLSQIIKSKYLVNKKYINMNDETSIGTTRDIFLTNLLSNDPATYEFLDSKLKPKEITK